jgi:hypothetical protein
MTYTYNLFGLTMSVPFPCSMLPQAPDGVIADVSVVEGSVARSLPSPIAEGNNWQASPGHFLLRGGNSAGRFLVEGGERITLERNPAAEEARLCAHLLASVIAALLRQRGLLVLHANVVITPQGNAVAISGETGSGKSTTHAALMAKGCRMLSDDITVLKLGHDGSAEVLPGFPKMNLCEDAAIKLGHDVSSLARYPLRSSKVIVPVVPDEMVSVSVPLKALYLLRKYPKTCLITTPLNGGAKFEALQECIYGPLFPEEHPNMFYLSCALIAQTDMFRLARPVIGWSVDEIVEVILHG